MKQLSKILLSIITVTPMVGCGNSSSSGGVAATATATELVSDPQLSGSVVNASHGDAISAVADQSTSGAGLLDASTADASKSKSKDSDSDSSTVTKTCAVSGLTAVVSISSSINRTKTDTKKSGTVTVERTRTGSGTMTRTWSRTDGVAVACNTGGSGANVDFQNPSGLKVDLAFERSREDKRTYTSTTLTRSSSRSFKASGKRSVTWSSNDATSDSSTSYFRNKSIVITDVKHDLTMTNKEGVSYSSSLTINTAADKPLVVKVERSKTDHSISSKTIVSGQIISKKDSDSTITTTYDAFKVGSDECKPVSGTATIVITDASGAVLKTLVLGAGTTGDGELKDKDSGTEIEGFALDDCDSEDKKI